jgi:hypothetical protein
MVSYAGAGVLTEIIKDILVQLFTEHTQECGLGAWEKGLTDAAALIEVMVVSYGFLIFVPKTVHNLVSL